MSLPTQCRSSTPDVKVGITGFGSSLLLDCLSETVRDHLRRNSCEPNARDFCAFNKVRELDIGGSRFRVWNVHRT